MDEEFLWAQARKRKADAEAGGGKDQYSGSILPFSIGPDGKARFDSNAGVLGALKRTVTLPREVYEGTVDLNTDEATGRVLEAASVISPMSPASRLAVKPGRVAPPSADDLIAEGGRQFDAMRATGVDYKSQSVAQLAQRVKKGLVDNGIMDIADGGAPSTHKLLDQLANPPGGSVANIAQLDAARKAASNIATTSASRVERGAARRLERELSGLIERADPATVVAGPAAEASTLARQARQNYAAGMRSDTLQGIERNADLRAAAAHSGQNIGNSIRSRLATLLADKKVRPGKPITGFTAEETAAIEGVVNGSRAANVTRRAGNMLGGGQGLGAAVVGGIGGAAGAAAGGVPGAAIGGAVPVIVGGALKSTSNALTRRALRGVDQMTRRRSPLYQQSLANPPMTPVHSGRAAALARALMLLEAEKQAEQP